MRRSSSSRDYVQSLARGLAVLRSVAGEGPSATLADIAARSGLSRAAARRLVLTLEHLGYVQATGREYRLTPRVLELGYGFLGARDLTDLAQPWMEQLAHQANESCSMAVLDGRDIVYVARVSVRKVMTVSLAVGARLPAYCTSMGRVLLAGLAPAARSTPGSRDWKRVATRTAPSSTRRGCVESSRTCAATAMSGSSRSSRPVCARWPCRSATAPARWSPRSISACRFTPTRAVARRRSCCRRSRQTAHAIERCMPANWLAPVGG